MSKTMLIAISVVLVLGVSIFMKEQGSERSSVSLDRGSLVLAFGDSLTYGFGAREDQSYPKYFQNKTGIKVINAGVNGEVSSQGVARIVKFLEHKPDLVILCHGGNDILNRLPASQLKKNLLEMIDLIKASGAEVLLVGVPDFSSFGFDTHPLYEEVAEEAGVLYEDEVLSQIELDRSLKSDYVHPNAKGYEKMADAFIETLGL